MGSPLADIDGAGGVRADAPSLDGSELARLIHATDWSRTSLGSPEKWSRGLHTMLGVMLRSRFPMLLWWGPEMLQLYNDAFRPILRDKHPASLGMPAAESWAEVWDVAGPMARGVLAGGPATWTEDLQLFINSGAMAEETYFTFSYSGVPDGDGRIGGVLNTVQETTVKVQSERQIRMRSELSACATKTSSESEFLLRAFAVLAANELDLPFAMLYVLDERREVATLAAHHGLGTHGWAGRPDRVPVSPEAGAATWPLAECLRAGRDVTVEDLHGRFGALPPGRWGRATEQAVVLPLSCSTPGVTDAFLIVGVSPHRVLEERYRRFFHATAESLTTLLAAARANEAEKKRAAALAEIDRAKTAFFSNVSHEFRTPLTLLLGPTRDALNSPERVLRGDALESVHRNAVRLMGLVNALLDFSRIEAGRMVARFAPHDFGAVTKQFAAAFQSAVEQAGLSFRLECPPSPEPVWLDVDLWEKVVLNLLSNALKYTFEGSITIRVRWVESRVALEVEDTGTGIPPDELPHIFERFHRVENARGRTHEGSGIGLALVRDLTALHGGTVAVRSELGRGSTFTVSIPRGQGHLPAERLSAPQVASVQGARIQSHANEVRRWIVGSSAGGDGRSPPTPRPVHPPGTPSVLVVDDNRDLREYLAGLLQEHYAVETAADGREALDAIRRRKPAVVISDVMMPNLDGLGLIRELRADPALAGVRIILLSARAGEEATVGGLEAGADEYLVKPFSARELQARVRTNIQLTQQRQIFDRFFALSPDMLAIANPDGQFTYVSSSFESLGYSRQELTSRPFLDFVHPEDKEETAREAGRLARGDKTTDFENRYVCKDGSYRWLSWRVVPDEGGMLYATARDVTEVKRAYELLARAQEETTAVNQELEAFSYSVAHDLRAPLRAIDGFSQALLEDCSEKLDDEGRKHLQLVRESAQHMARLIDDLLSLSRVSRMDLERDRVDLSAMAGSILSRLQQGDPARRVDLNIEPGLIVDGDPRLLAVAMENLLGNAWKFTSKTPCARIEFGAHERDGRRVYFVRDNGAGFDMAYQSKLFGVFQRLHSSSEFEGTGVGLATVRRVLARHGGGVWAHGVVNGGGVFSFTLDDNGGRTHELGTDDPAG